MAKNVEYSPFMFPSTFLSYPSESTPSSSSSPLPPSFGSSRSNSSFNSPYKSSSSLPLPPLSHSSSSHFPPATFGPCASCKIHNRRCSDKCYIASFLPPNQVHNFAVVYSLFGSADVVNFVQHSSNTSYVPLLLLLRDTNREDEVDSDPHINTLTNNLKQLGESENFSPVMELKKARELANELKAMVSSMSPADTIIAEHLVHMISSSFQKTLSALNLSEQQNDVAPIVNDNNHPSESPVYMDASPGGLNFREIHNGSAKKRKTLPIWTDDVTVASENGLEEHLDDGYSWIKYGQNDVLGAKHPRSYYRCIHRITKNCCATKRVKRSDEGPTLFEVSYRRAHTCYNGPQALPEKQEEQNNVGRNNQQQQLQGTRNNFQPSDNYHSWMRISPQPLELDLTLK